MFFGDLHFVRYHDSKDVCEVDNKKDQERQTEIKHKFRNWGIFWKFVDRHVNADDAKYNVQPPPTFGFLVNYEPYQF